MTIDHVPFLDLRRQHSQLREELDATIGAVLDKADFVKGAAVGRFEDHFAEYQAAQHCIAVGNGTDALEIAIEALDLPPGSEIIVPANSFIATSEAVTRTGHSVIFADVDDTYTLNPESVESFITDRTAAVVGVHLYGQPSDLASLKSLCLRHDLRLIEDAAQAHGAEFQGKRVGALGDVGTFSFFPGKNLGAIGDAGAIVTNDSDLAKRCRRIADHGRVSKYDHDIEGRNSRMDTIQAAVLDAKLPHLDGWLQTRRDTAAQYRRLLIDEFPGAGDAPFAEWRKLCAPGELKLGRVSASVLHSYHLFVVRVSSRGAVQKQLREAGIASGVHYPSLLPRLSAYEDHPQSAQAFACSAWPDELLSLPIGDHMTQQMTDRVVEVLAETATVR